MALQQDLISVLDQIITALKLKTEGEEFFITKDNIPPNIPLLGALDIIQTLSNKHPLALMVSPILDKKMHGFKVLNANLELLSALKKETIGYAGATERGKESKVEIFISAKKGIYRNNIGKPYPVKNKRMEIILELVKSDKKGSDLVKKYSSYSQLNKSIKAINLLFKKQLELAKNSENLILHLPTGWFSLNRDYYAIK